MMDSERHGVYFDLAEDEYHADPALGSTDLRRLLASGPDYWWNSPLNPNRPEDHSTPALEYGSALHLMVLKGRQAFSSRYIRRPDDLKVLTAKARAKLAPNGEGVLPGEDYDRIEIAGELIRKNPAFAEAFTGGVSEVSVFWAETFEGAQIRLKARFDFLKPRAIVDLKSIRNPLGLPFPENCRRAIANGYAIQAAHYLVGRQQLGELVAHDLVFGDHDPTWLRRISSNSDYAFVFVFFQADSAPIVWGCTLSPGSPNLEIAGRKRQDALATYSAYKQNFSGDDMWMLLEPISELEISDMPGWYR